MSDLSKLKTKPVANPNCETCAFVVDSIRGRQMCGRWEKENQLPDSMFCDHYFPNYERRAKEGRVEFDGAVYVFIDPATDPRRARKPARGRTIAA